MQATTTEESESRRNSRPIRRFFFAALMRAFHIYDRHRQRIHLSELDDHLLDDVGLKPADVRRERATPFWR